MLVQEPVQAAVWHCLNHYNYNDAIFLAEKLRAEVESDETIWLLATCYYRSGKPSHAYHILKNTSSPQCRFLLAKCCVDLQKMSEAETVLCGGLLGGNIKLDELLKYYGDIGSFALMLLASICFHNDRHHKALEATATALKINPLLWSGFETLCKAGERPNPNEVFNLVSVENLSNVTGTHPVINYVNSQQTSLASSVCKTNWISPNGNFTPPPNDVSTPIQIVNMGGTCMSGVRAFTPQSSPIPLPLSCRPKRSIRYSNIFPGTVSSLTPSFGVIPLDQLTSFDSYPSPLNTLTEANDQKLIAKRNLGFGLRLEPEKDSSSPQTNAPRIPPRRSTRLFSNSSNVKENSKSPNNSKFNTPLSSRKTKNSRGMGKGVKNSGNNTSEVMNEKNKSGDFNSAQESSQEGNAGKLNTQATALQRHSMEGLTTLLKELGKAFIYISQFECKKAIRCLSQLPPHHRNTGWVLSLIAKAYFEDNDYKHAAKYFAEVRSKEPERTQMMEIYSTSLWHLSKENQLSALAQDMVQTNKNCPETWCVVGNCMSLQKEHDQAIKFFQRAVQVDPSFAYAYTLLGHEYTVTDELEKGMSCFRNAVRLDSRHYNAWYGMGTIYSKQDKFQLAEMHYKRALSINHFSSVLMCHIGVMQLAQQKKEEALETLNQALRLEPNNALCKFHRASVLVSCSAYQEALVELEQLKELVPKESLVYYLTGKVHKTLGNTHLALMHFSWATDLDPKGATPQIKESIEPSIPHSRTPDHQGEDPTVEESDQRSQGQDPDDPEFNF